VFGAVGRLAPCRAAGSRVHRTHAPCHFHCERSRATRATTSARGDALPSAEPGNLGYASCAISGSGHSAPHVAQTTHDPNASGGAPPSSASRDSRRVRPLPQFGHGPRGEPVKVSPAFSSLTSSVVTREHPARPSRYVARYSSAIRSIGHVQARSAAWRWGWRRRSSLLYGACSRSRRVGVARRRLGKAATAVEPDSGAKVSSCAPAWDYLDDPVLDERAILLARWRCRLETPREGHAEWCVLWAGGEALDLGFPSDLMLSGEPSC
jgi:hypothetical protein